MTARPAGPRIVVATLHIDAGERTRTGRWVRQPTATYTCNRCWFHETVTGPERVLAFTAHIRQTHHQACRTAAAPGRKAA